MQLRAGTVQDAEAIARIIATFQRELTDDPDGIGAEAYLARVSVEAERGYLESARYAFTIAERGGTMVGFIALRDVSHIFHLFVDRQHQGTGVARLLWEHARAQVLTAAKPGQFTVNSSLRAVGVYRTFGFEPTGDAVSAHGISFVPMRLVIDSSGAPR